jgi:DNA-binding transcriptional LysR family regulator
MMVCDETKGGALVRLTPEWVPKGGIIHAVFPSRRGQLPSVRKLIDYLAMRFEQVDES